MPYQQVCNSAVYVRCTSYTQRNYGLKKIEQFTTWEADLKTERPNNANVRCTSYTQRNYELKKIEQIATSGADTATERPNNANVRTYINIRTYFDEKTQKNIEQSATRPRTKKRTRPYSDRGPLGQLGNNLRLVVDGNRQA